MVSLSNLLKGQPDGIDFKVDYIEPLKAHKKKAGGEYDAHSVKLVTTANNEVYDAIMFPQFVATIKVGDLVRGFINAKGYSEFRKVQSGEPSNNYQEVNKERAMASQRDETVISMILHGFMSAAISEGKTPVEAGRIAIAAYDIHKQSVDFILKQQ